MGGAVVITAEAGTAGAEKPQVDGTILVAPAVWGRQTMNVFMRTALWAADAIAPRWTLTGSGLHIWPSDNIEMLRAFSRDPLVIKGTRVAAVSGLVDIMSEALAAAPKANSRMLMLYGAHDELVPPEPVKKFIAALPPAKSGQRVVAYYDKGYHMLLRDLEAKTVIDDVASWVLSADAPLPSGADIRAAQVLEPKARG
jgi:alpha-beta hydrolase superfamily lysophospholipase